MKRTITIDTDLHVVIPVSLTHEMTVAAYGADRTLSAVYAALLAAVPDDLPGVVEHGGETVWWLCECDSPALNYDEQTQFVCTKRDADEHAADGYVVTELFTHTPAPAELTAVQKAAPEMRDALYEMWHSTRMSDNGTPSKEAYSMARDVIAKLVGK